MSFAVKRMKKRKNAAGVVLISIGMILIASALALTVYNIWDDSRAGAEANEVLEQLDEVIKEAVKQPSSGSTDLQSPGVVVDQVGPPAYEEYIPDYLLNPGKNMPSVIIDGRRYIGKLDIPSLNISLPVTDECTLTLLKKSPGRYSGSVYLHNIVICGHNYASHLGRLKNILVGDTVIFTDVDGNVFEYSVSEIVTIPGTGVEEMKAGDDWDLTVFTCNKGGKARITVRCVLKK